VKAVTPPGRRDSGAGVVARAVVDGAVAVVVGGLVVVAVTVGVVTTVAVVLGVVLLVGTELTVVDV
jgi:hypothetical protein